LSTKNKSSRLGLEGTEADVVFYADSESVVRSVNIIIRVKVMTTKPGFAAFFKSDPMMLELRYLTARVYFIFVPYIVGLWVL
jgi:hypothetical protein